MIEDIVLDSYETDDLKRLIKKQKAKEKKRKS